MKKAWWIGGAVVAAAAVIFFATRGDSIDYTTETVSRGTIRAFCTATGRVNPITTVRVGTQVSGRIKALYADYNSPVTAGQLVAEIDPEPFEAQLEQARANLLSARAGLQQAKVTLEEAERNLARSRKLFADSVIGQSEFDAVETKRDVAKSSLGVARAQVVQSEAAYKYAETNLKYTRIYSPVDGIVISRDVDVGQTVAATFQTPTLFTIAEDLKKMQINTNVDEADIGKIREGQDAEFIVDAYPDSPFYGRVEQVRNSPEVVQNVVTYDVVISVDNDELKLKPGMTANVTIITSVKKDVLKIPNAALRFKPEDEKDTVEGTNVWVLKKSSPVPVPVTTGIDDYEYTELVEGDIAAGEEVLVGQVKKK